MHADTPNPNSNDGITNLGFAEEQATFESPSQNARVLTEGWFKAWAFCPKCGASDFSQFANNNPATDFECRSCRETFELKGKKGKLGRRVADGAYGTMRAKLLSGQNPNLALLTYNPTQVAVTNLIIIPKFFMSVGVLQERKPLAPTARRAGWIGCNIQLDMVPESGKIFLVRNGLAQSKESVRENWKRTVFLNDESATARGWLIDVMRCVERIPNKEFTLDSVYAFEGELSRIYPGNNNVRPKIRQQLQVLRDHGYLDFLSRGTYRVRWKP